MTSPGRVGGVAFGERVRTGVASVEPDLLRRIEALAATAGSGDAVEAEPAVTPAALTALRGELGALRAEVGVVRAQLAALRDVIEANGGRLDGALRREIEALREDLADALEEVRDGVASDVSAGADRIEATGAAVRAGLGDLSVAVAAALRAAEESSARSRQLADVVERVAAAVTESGRRDAPPG